MLINERPGVYSSVEVSSSLSRSGAGRTIGIAAVSALGEKGVCSLVTSYGQAVSLYGADCAITKLIKILILNGASQIRAVPAAVSETATDDDYKVAFDALMKQESISVMLCDSRRSSVHNALRLAIDRANEEAKYRIAVVEGFGSISELTQMAADINHERIVMLTAPDSVESLAGALSAAFAGVLAAGGDPALPMNGAELTGLGQIFSSFSDADITALIQGGITPVEGHAGKNLVVRGITTRTTTAGASDATWRELTTMLIIDNVIPTLRSDLRTRFARVKNTSQTRGAIRTQVLIELERKLKQEIIDDYGAVSVQAVEGDPCVCEVSFEFTVAHGLNRINLAASISV